MSARKELEHRRMGLVPVILNDAQASVTVRAKCEVCGLEVEIDQDVALFSGWTEEEQEDGTTRFVRCPECTEYSER